MLWILRWLILVEQVFSHLWKLLKSRKHMLIQYDIYIQFYAKAISWGCLLAGFALQMEAVTHFFGGLEVRKS